MCDAPGRRRSKSGYARPRTTASRWTTSPPWPMRTRIIVMSTLEWCNGWASDMKAIGDFCQEKGIFLVVDAVQELGVTKIGHQAVPL